MDRKEVDLIVGSTLFDPDYYLRSYPDVRGNGQNPLMHFVEWGWKERRNPHPLFDTDYYLRNNADIAKEGINPLLHFLLYGAKEKRNPHPLFDSQYYLEECPEAEKKEWNPLVHFIKEGCRAYCNPHPLFDVRFYLEKNPEVAQSEINPLIHFVEQGWKEGRNPHPAFDLNYYLQQNPDVKEAKVNPLIHFIEYGWKEKRRPHPDFPIGNLESIEAFSQAFVGPSSQFDFMGATQFSLLWSLGLRSCHYLLDFGCGALRAGRFFIQYLQKGRYFGIEPNRWLIEEAIKHQLGEDTIRLKKPVFDHNDRFCVEVFGIDFDFILAQSIFSHTGSDLIIQVLNNFKRSLKEDGLIVCTFVEGDEDFVGSGWIYPEIVRYKPETIHSFAQSAGLFIRRLKWYHPRQSWFLLAKDKRRLPDPKAVELLSGIVLYEPEFEEGWKERKTIIPLLQNLQEQDKNELLNSFSYAQLDPFYIQLDKHYVRRTKNICLIPSEKNRRGGKYSYGEWAHVIGIFQTLFYFNLENKMANKILDVGCGTGLLAIASEPYIQDGGYYVGLDVSKEDIQFCLSHYPPAQFKFIHFDLSNSLYAPDQNPKLRPWPLEAHQFDLVTALSVWTHLREEEARFYFKEIRRVLKPQGRAIITFFFLDQIYKESLLRRSFGEQGSFHRTDQGRWVFELPVSGSEHWRCPQWAKIPEEAIGIDEQGLKELMEESRLMQLAYYPGNWKEIPGIFFQDIFVFQPE